jgi:hypothetical protein
LATDERVSDGGTGSERWDDHNPLYHSEIRGEVIRVRLDFLRGRGLGMRSSEKSSLTLITVHELQK